MREDLQVRVRVGLGLGVIAVTLLLLPLGLNWVRGGATGVGYDPRTQGSALVFAVSYEQGLSSEPVDGRLILVVARDSSPEPRFRVGPGPGGQQVFGRDVRGWQAGKQIDVTDTELGFPLESLALIPPGYYWVQGVLDRYQTFRPDSGASVLLPTRQPGVPWNLAPGNLVSRPVRVRLDPRSEDRVRVDLSRTIVSPPAPEETARLRHLRVPSDRLSNFWGQPVEVDASVLLPEGWASHPNARFPVVMVMGPGPGDGSTGPGDRSDSMGGTTGRADPASALGETSEPDSPVLLVRVGGKGAQVPGVLPVNSENMGPWADALLLELLPEVERRFRGVGRPWARALYGTGTRGWSALGALLTYPDSLAGLWAPCADPRSLSDYAGLSLHDQTNAYLYQRAWGTTPRPGWGQGGGGSQQTLEQENHLELVLGTRGRSGGWWDAWQAAYSPRGDDGFPMPVWDKRTGRVDQGVADAWRRRPDLSLLVGDEGEAAPSLLAKLHLGSTAPGALATPGRGAAEIPDICGATDDGSVFWPTAEALSALLGGMVEEAPQGADTTSWRY